MGRRLTTEEWIARAHAVHGERYDYSRVKYVNKTTDVTIGCLAHGDFEQVPHNHVAGANGCPGCARESKAQTTEEWVAKARAKHGNCYDYSRVEYFNSRTKVTIGCPDHGWFEQKARTHSDGFGCPSCSPQALLTTEEWIAQARAKHGDKYDYSRVKYVGGKTNVVIGCPDHGWFTQQPTNHSSAGKGCYECSLKTRAVNTCSTEEWIAKARSVHGDRYDYSKVAYTYAKADVIIICAEHGEFLQWPATHTTNKSGCPECGEYGFQKNKPATLYFLRVETRNQLLYKVGITNRSVEERFTKDRDLITVLYEQHYEVGSDAHEAEQIILNATKEHAYTGADILVSGGNTELRTCDLTPYINEVQRQESSQPA